MNETKKCNKCGEVKELGEFYRDKYNKKDGRMNTCKTCDNAYQKSWREKVKGKVNQEVEKEVGALALA